MSERDLDPLDPDLERLLSAERARPAPPRSERERIRWQVQATLGAGVFGDGGGAPSGADPGGPAGADLPADGGLPAGGFGGAGGAAAGSLVGGGLMKLFAGGLLVSAFAGAVGAFALGERGSSQPGRAAIAGVAALSPSPPAHRKEASAEGEAPRASTVDAPSTKGAEVATPSSAAPARSVVEPEAVRAGRDDVLAAERALLEVARSAVAGGRSAAALEALGRHAREFPGGRLSEEREGLWIRVLIGAGRLEEARQRASRFRRSYPRSMLLQSFEEALGTIP